MAPLVSLQMGIIRLYPLRRSYTQLIRLHRCQRVHRCQLTPTRLQSILIVQLKSIMGIRRVGQQHQATTPFNQMGPLS